MISFNDCDTAATPCTRQIQVVCALATDVAFADMFLSEVRSSSMGFKRVESAYVELFSICSALAAA